MGPGGWMPGSAPAEKHVELTVNRRFKRRGHAVVQTGSPQPAGHPTGGDRLEVTHPALALPQKGPSSPTTRGEPQGPTSGRLGSLLRFGMPSPRKATGPTGASPGRFCIPSWTPARGAVLVRKAPDLTS